MKIISYVVSVVLLSIIFIGFSFSYFEHKYWCEISDGRLIVSLKRENDNFVKCLNILKNIDNQLKNIGKNINIANKYIKKGDNQWKSILNENLQKKQEVIKFRKDFLKKIGVFEDKLFWTIKPYVLSYMQKEIDKMKLKKINLIDLKNKYLLAGDIDNLKQLIKEVDEIEYILILLKNIKASTNFYEMMPSLKRYLKIKKNEYR